MLILDSLQASSEQLWRFEGTPRSAERPSETLEGLASEVGGGALPGGGEGGKLPGTSI